MSPIFKRSALHFNVIVVSCRILWHEGYAKATYDINSHSYTAQPYEKFSLCLTDVSSPSH
jgi:hypothetical protein